MADWTEGKINQYYAKCQKTIDAIDLGIKALRTMKIVENTNESLSASLKYFNETSAEDKV